jgi:hypothetical protein
MGVWFFVLITCLVVELSSLEDGPGEMVIDTCESNHMKVMEGGGTSC